MPSVRGRVSNVTFLQSNGKLSLEYAGLKVELYVDGGVLMLSNDVKFTSALHTSTLSLMHDHCKSFYLTAAGAQMP